MLNFLNSFLLGYVAIGATMYTLSRVNMARRRRLDPSAVIASRRECAKLCAIWPLPLAMTIYFCATDYLYYDRPS